MIYKLAGLMLGLYVGTVVMAQDGMGDILSGNLVKPKSGVWTWYDVKDEQGTDSSKLRLAIVGEEKVNNVPGYWLELEVVPSLGYKSIYKMLLTGPADDPRNIHRLLRREGTEKTQEIPLTAESKTDETAAKSKRTKVGEEDVVTPCGTIHASHYKVEGSSNASELWVNESISPMGIVQMKSPNGSMLIRATGEGGQEAQSVIDKTPAADERSGSDVKVKVSVEKGKGDRVLSEGKVKKKGKTE